MKCPKCGSEYNDNTKYCNLCLYLFDKASTDVKPAAVPAAPAKPTESDEILAGMRRADLEA